MNPGADKKRDMLSFRQKIFITYLVLFALFLAFMYPLATWTVQKIATHALEERATSIIAGVKGASNDQELIERLKNLKATAFFRVSVISNAKKVLYDSHAERLLGSTFTQEYVVEHPEVLEAFANGVGYHEDYSNLFAQRLAYMAKVFNFHGLPYVLRLAFPFEFVSQIMRDLVTGFLLFTTAILLLFSLMTWFIMNHLTQPIQQIINAVKPYQTGETTLIPKIDLPAQDDFSQLAQTLNSLSDRIQVHINSLKDFVANASHELKTPITIIHGFAETLHDNPQLPQETHQDITGKIVRNCERMDHIIKDLLLLTNIENIPESRLKKCDLEEIVKNSCDTVKAIYPTAEIAVEKPSNQNFTLLADPDLLELVFNNLIENAAKYSPLTPSIKISLKKNGTWISAAVSDKGIGIPQEDLPHIFDRFYRVDKGRSRKMGGTGLGLSIANTIIIKHGGKIAASSNLGQGTTLTVLLPIC